MQKSAVRNPVTPASNVIQFINMQNSGNINVQNVQGVNKMKLTKEQTNELQEHGYDPCVRHVNLYPEDFEHGIWNQVLQSLNLKESSGVVLAVVGIKETDDEV
jgi:hypothetical protein|tara:strand:+ start:71 stop:379 length:309 start_codon:yes stop_codon:yes gene_type:complete